MVVAAPACAGTHGQAAAVPAAAFPSRAPAMRQRVQQQPTCSFRQPHAQQQGRQHTIQQRQRCSAASTAGSSSAAASAEPGPEEPPSAQELAEAEALLREFMEGMGASGELSRPEDLDLPEGRLTWAEANSILGMSGWRLNNKLCPEIQELVTQIEGCWRAVLPEDQFGLYDVPERYRYLDSLDPEGEDPFAFRSLPDPQKGEPGYPRLQLENRAYWSRAFRKLHIEVAARQDGLQVFHCVMYPRVNFDLPILSMDLVANQGRVSLAVVDPCPVTPNLELPPFYEQPVRDLQARYGLESNRGVPDWGRAIFSPLCIIVRPESGVELGAFLKYALALTQMHVQIAKIAHPVGRAQRRRLELVHAAHRRFCEKQLENDKTRRVLEAAFGAELAAAYMREMMFDCPEQLEIPAS